MKSTKVLYLTTTLPYVNAEPHIGHALEFIQADVIARYFRQEGYDVLFNTGTDEHGLKIYEAAMKERIGPNDFVDKYSGRFKDFCKAFNISYDTFIRTTDKQHVKAATQFWLTSLKNGNIYKKHYTGKYCVGCEEFKTSKDLVEGKCPNHINKELIDYSEENYFFKFSNYQEKLLSLYQNNPEFIRPKSKFNEMVSFVKAGLEDFSISRRKENLPWGVPVPGDDEQVIYVWFDALVSYITAIGYGSDKKQFDKWWPVVQLCGPDNNRFQSAMWQAMLLSAGLKNSKQILVHGMIMDEQGRKMSKTMGNVISPFELLRKYGSESVRYYLIAGLPTYSDGSFSSSQLEAVYKSDLQNNFGNLLNRVITLSSKFDATSIQSSLATENFRNEVFKFYDEYKQQMNAFNLFEAFEKAKALADMGNKYIASERPWESGVKPNDKSMILSNLLLLLEVLIEMYRPLLPSTAKKAKESLNQRKSIILFMDLS